jgi:hypothetical protein
MDRQEGYYWVKYKGKYYVGYYDVIHGTPMWSLMGDEYVFEDSDFEHINENRIKQPGELPEF